MQDSLTGHQFVFNYNKYKVNFDDLPVIPESPGGLKSFARCDIHIPQKNANVLGVPKLTKFSEKSDYGEESSVDSVEA
jgi:hypothetical protein